MKRPFVWYLLGVVLPCAATMMVAGGQARDAWHALRHTSHAHVGYMALAALEQELGQEVSRLVPEAEAVPDPDPSIPAMQRAMSGDTVAALSATPRGVELAVVLGGTLAPGDTARPVLYAFTSFAPISPDRVARATGYRVNFYLNGQRWGDGEAPELLSEETLQALSQTSRGVPMPGDGEGVLMANSAQPGTPPSLVALVRPGTPPPPSIEIRILVVLGLLILFSVLAGWIQLARPPEPTGRRPGPLSLLTLGMVPALTATLFLVHLSRTFETAAADAAVRDLTRGLAVAGSLDLASSPTSVRQVTGFHATLVRSGELLASTFAGDASEITHLPAPPPSFTTSGTVETPEGPSFYLALRRRGGQVIVATTPLPAARLAEVQGVFVRTGLIMLLWLLAVGAALAVFGRGRRAPGASA